MPVPEMSFDQIYNRARQRIIADGRFSSLSSSSTTRMFLELFASELGFAFSAAKREIEQTQLSRANGAFLEDLGRLVGTFRFTATRPQDNTRANFKFFVDPALGLDIRGLLSQRMDSTTIENNPDTLSSTSITIRAGMLITDPGGGKVYRTTDNAVITEWEAFVPVIADGVGRAYNVGVGELSKWQDTLQPEMIRIKDFILCTNLAPITSGRSSEGDESLRARIFNAIPANAMANFISLRSAAMSVPGVRSAEIIPAWKGPGTVKVNISSTSPIVSEGLINAVRQTVRSVAATGEKIFVDRPTYLGVQIKICILFTPTAQNRTQTLRDIRQRVVDYINNLGVGGKMIVNEIRERIQSTSEDILDHIIAYVNIGTFNPTTAKNENVRTVSTVNQKADVDEQFYTNSAYVIVCDDL